MRYGSATRKEAAFSLLEVLVALAITIGIGAAAFYLFHQNERIFRDQSLIMEMQQSARVAISQIADDIRLAGEGVPAGVGDIILPGSGGSRLNIRLGFSSGESIVTSSLPLSVTNGSPSNVTVESTAAFSAGREAFLWADDSWSRVTINAVSGPAKSVRLTPSVSSKSPLQFVSPPVLSLDEAVAIYRDPITNTIRQTTATSTQNPSSPAWAPANELAANVTTLTLLYYDAAGSAVAPDTAEHRSQIHSIEARLTVRSSSPLSDGSRPTYALSVRVQPRNLQFRQGYFKAQWMAAIPPERFR